MNFYVKIHENPREKLVAICDAEVIGKHINHNGVKLYINEKFYGSKIYPAEDVLHILKNSTSYNVIGKKICELLIEHNLIHPDTVMWIDDNENKIGHAIVVTSR